MRAHGLDADAFRNVTYASSRWNADDGLAGKYFLERRPVPLVAGCSNRTAPFSIGSRDISNRSTRSKSWSQFIPRAQSARLRSLASRRSPRSGDLTQDAARSIAVAFASSMGADTAGMELKDAKSEKKKARRDYEFEWAAPPGDPRNVDETTYRVEVEVDGDQPASFRSHWKVPEAFERAREQKNFYSILATVLYLAAWRRAWCGASSWCFEDPGGANAVAAGPHDRRAGGHAQRLAAILSLNLALRNYPTETPFENLPGEPLPECRRLGHPGVPAVRRRRGADHRRISRLPGRVSHAARRLLGLDAVIALVAAIGLGLAVQKAGASPQQLLSRSGALRYRQPRAPHRKSARPRRAGRIPASDSARRRHHRRPGGVSLGTVRAMANRPAPGRPCALLSLEIHTAGEFALSMDSRSSW